MTSRQLLEGDRRDGVRDAHGRVHRLTMRQIAERRVAERMQLDPEVRARWPHIGRDNVAQVLADGWLRERRRRHLAEELGGDVVADVDGQLRLQLEEVGR